MKRSEINKIQREAVDFFKKNKFYLPPWAYWTREDWVKNQHRVSEVIKNGLGWDVTDFGTDNFDENGLLLFTLRNGNLSNSQGKPYAEKIMIVHERQVTPWHFHWNKMEDIINRGGGNLVIELSNSLNEYNFADTKVKVKLDSVDYEFEPKEQVVLKPGESISLPQFLFHTFYGEEGAGPVLVGEVSAVNDDAKDNNFMGLKMPRYPEIEEDEPPLYYLCWEYPV
ncbi:D-lyxose/D-mannose family sugar isomerase [candidate division KSB1 bacterium]|nr:D-lyxose/D-mannose family sugar isomerase [candidate division KSB1 bacterium]